MSITIRTILVFAGLSAAWAMAPGRVGLHYVALAAAGLMLAAMAVEWVRSRSAKNAAGHEKPDPGVLSFLAALRGESDIVASSFEEDSLLLAVLAQLDHGAFGSAVKVIKNSLGCDSKDAGLLAREVDRVARRVRGGTSTEPAA